MLSQINAGEAREVALKCLAAATADEVEEIVRNEFKARWPELFPPNTLPQPTTTSMNEPQLVNLLIAKSILETILVGTIAVVVYLNAFPPTFHGWGEAVVGDAEISGWAVNDAIRGDVLRCNYSSMENLSERRWPNSRGLMWLLLDGPKMSGMGTALWSLDWLPGMHEARVYALHRERRSRYTLQMLGDPIRFEVNADGSWTDASADTDS